MLKFKKKNNDNRSRTHMHITQIIDNFGNLKARKVKFKLLIIKYPIKDNIHFFLHLF